MLIPSWIITKSQKSELEQAARNVIAADLKLRDAEVALRAAQMARTICQRNSYEASSKYSFICGSFIQLPKDKNSFAQVGGQQ